MSDASGPAEQAQSNDSNSFQIKTARFSSPYPDAIYAAQHITAMAQTIGGPDRHEAIASNFCSRESLKPAN